MLRGRRRTLQIGGAWVSAVGRLAALHFVSLACAVTDYSEPLPTSGTLASRYSE